MTLVHWLSCVRAGTQIHEGDPHVTDSAFRFYELHYLFASSHPLCLWIDGLSPLTSNYLSSMCPRRYVERDTKMPVT